MLKAKSREIRKKGLQWPKTENTGLGQPGIRIKGTNLKVKLYNHNLNDMIWKNKSKPEKDKGNSKTVLSAYLPHSTLGM